MKRLLAALLLLAAPAAGQLGEPTASALSSDPAACTDGQFGVDTDATAALSCQWIRTRTHATDCTALTDGLAGELCCDLDSDDCWRCEPTAGGCDTVGEWIAVGGGGTPTEFLDGDTGCSATDGSDITCDVDAAEVLGLYGSGGTDVNQVRITSAPTGAGPTIAAAGGDANINLRLTGVGTGAVVVLEGDGGGDTVTIDPSSSTGNIAHNGFLWLGGSQLRLNAGGAAAEMSVSTSVIGLGAGVDFELWGATSYINNVANPLTLQADDTTGIVIQKAASGINYMSVTPGATGVGVTVAAAGGDANIDLVLAGKGTGVVQVESYIGGEISEDDLGGATTDITVTTAGTYYGWVSADAATTSGGVTSDITITAGEPGDKLTVPAGTYSSSFAASFSGSNSAQMTCCIFDDGARTRACLERTLGAAGASGSAGTGTYHLDFGASSVVDVRCTSDSNGDTIAFKSAVLSVRRIGS